MAAKVVAALGLGESLNLRELEEVVARDKKGKKGALRCRLGAREVVRRLREASIPQKRRPPVSLPGGMPRTRSKA